MGARTRAIDLAAQRTNRQLRDLGEEFRERRMTLALSQAHVAGTSRMSRNHHGQIENGVCPTITVAEINTIATVLGLSPSLRVYPDGAPVRDAAHSTRLQRFLGAVGTGLSFRTEVPLPAQQDRPERRAWDAVIFEGRQKCAVELEMRLRDVQAVLRRVDLKRRDDPTESFLLLVADTAVNRRVLAEFEALFSDLPRLRPSRVMAALREGRLPPTGLMLV